MVKKGKKLVIGMIVIIFLLDIIVIALLSSIYALNGRIDLASYKLLQGVFRLVLTGLLSFFVYKGYKWAKWVLVVLFMIVGVFGLMSLLSEFNLILAGMSLIYVCFAVIMISSRSVNSFFLYQRDLDHSDPDENIEINDINSDSAQE